MPERPQQMELHAELVLTQFGMRSPALTGQGPAHFRRAPRRHERDVSLLAGRLTAREAAMAVRHGRREYFPSKDVVRYTTVGRLRDAGFVVRSTPSPMITNHVSVEYDGDWTDDVANDAAKRFDDCFDRPVGGGDGHS
jgi:hypothetical protein